MPNLSIKDVPEQIAQALRDRAVRNHRSLQGELMAIIESAASSSAPQESFDSVPESSAAMSDDLLGALDAMIAGSSWGCAPILSREQANSRAVGDGGLQ